MQREQETPPSFLYLRFRQQIEPNILFSQVFLLFQMHSNRSTKKTKLEKTKTWRAFSAKKYPSHNYYLLQAQ